MCGYTDLRTDSDVRLEGGVSSERHTRSPGCSRFRVRVASSTWGGSTRLAPYNNGPGFLAFPRLGILASRCLLFLHTPLLICSLPHDSFFFCPALLPSARSTLWMEGLSEEELVPYSALNEEAEAVPIGCEGLVRVHILLSHSHNVTRGG